MKLLHLVASPRGEQSNTMRISQSFLDGLAASHADVEVETVDLYHHDLPAVAGLNIEAKYTLMMGQPITANMPSRGPTSSAPSRSSSRPTPTS